MGAHEEQYTLTFRLFAHAPKDKIKQDHQALLKAKYCPRVAAVSCTQKNTKKPM